MRGRRVSKLQSQDGAYIRKEFFGKYPELLKLVEHMSDEEVWALRRGGHDPQKVYNAYKRAVEHTGSPTVILAKTIKGYGLGEAGEGRNVTHQQKKLNEDEMAYFRKRFDIPIPEETVHTTSFYRPPEDSAGDCATSANAAKRMGGSLPARIVKKIEIQGPAARTVRRSAGRFAGPRSLHHHGVRARAHAAAEGSRTSASTSCRSFRTKRALSAWSRCSGSTAFTPAGASSTSPWIARMFLFYKEAKNGQILEEGITEAGSMASFTAAGTAYANYGVPMIPFFIYYSMFGFQRIGDLIWAFADSRGKGFLMGGTAGRTTLSGEGLQHQDGHSLVLSSTVPTCRSYDPAYAYEIAVIIQDGIRRMYQEMEDRFYYLTVYNENYAQPPMPEGVTRRDSARHLSLPAGRERQGEAAVVRQRPDSERSAAGAADPGGELPGAGRRLVRHQLQRTAPRRAGSGALEPAASRRARTQALSAKALAGVEGPIIASTDYMKVVADQIAPWLPGRLVSLGTDGFGRSENREHLRKHFENGAEAIAAAALSRLARDGKFDKKRAKAAIGELGLNPDSPDPVTV